MVLASLADAILIVHFLWVLAILVPIPLIAIGAHRTGRLWNWTRNFTLRVIHFLMMAIVLAESVIGIACPLTTWENTLREKASQAPYDRSFMAYWVGRILFHDFPAWAFTLVYAGVTATIILLWRVAPPLRKKKGAGSLRRPHREL